MTRSWSDGAITRQDRARQRAQMWLRYAKCDWCNAQPKMPCRDGITTGGARLPMERPHTGRALLPEEEKP
jgi:hypothetical protein